METEHPQTTSNRLHALQSAIEVSGVGFWQLHADDSLECDATARHFLNLQPEVRLADLTDFLMQIEESQHEALLDAIDRARNQDQSMDLSLRLEKAESADASGFRLTAGPHSLPDEPGVSLCGLIRPLLSSSEVEKRSENALREVRSANEELANFASIASHDMREPLRMITSYLGLLKERSPEALDDRARRYIKYACDGADRMRHLIDDLLSYARLDKPSKPFEALALEDIMAQAIDNLRTIIGETRAEVTVAIDQAPIVMGDSVRLVRLFQNLIANGIKFNRPEQIPRVHVGFKDGDHGEAPGKWIVSIEDQGIGIDPDHHDMLFNLFQRLNTRDEFEGSGIGLAVSKKIAEQHGGRIWFTSSKGHGSTFFIALDKAAPQNLR